MKRESKKPDFNFRTSPETEKVDPATHEEFKTFTTDILAVAKKYGYDNVMLVAGKEVQSRTLYSAVIGTEDEVEAVGLLLQAQNAVQQLIRAQRPTGPGGIA